LAQKALSAPSPTTWSSLKSQPPLRELLNCPPEMRGQQARSGSLFFFVSIEEQLPASYPPRLIRKWAVKTLDRLNPPFRAVRLRRPAIGAARATAAGLVAAGVLGDRLEAFAAGKAQLQPPVPLVGVSEPVCSDLAPNHFHQEHRGA
jgi:hypothetical protein